MAALSALRALVYVYLGTKASDPMYPTTTVDALLNAAANKYAADVQQANPSYMRAVTTLTAASANTYTLPDDFAGWLDVRLTDARGVPLEEVRDDELNAASFSDAFAITGADDAATLTTARGVAEDAALYLKYRTQPAVLADAADAPSWMPAQFHDLLAREAAIDAFGVGNEAAPPARFTEETEDRRGQFWLHIGRRGVGSQRTRESL